MAEVLDEVDDTARGDRGGTGTEPGWWTRRWSTISAEAGKHGMDMAGQGGLFVQLAKTVLERSLAAELTEHLGYEEGNPAGPGVGQQPRRLDAQEARDSGGAWTWGKWQPVRPSRPGRER